MRVINIVAELDEVAPKVLWSDDVGTWADGGRGGGSRWITVSRVKLAGSNQYLGGNVLEAGGADWIAVDPISPSGALVDLVGDSGVVSQYPLLPGSVLHFRGLREIRFIAGPEQSDLVRMRIWVGVGVCPIASFGGGAAVPGRPLPVMLRSAPDSSDLTQARTFVQVVAVPSGSVVKLGTWSGRSFAGGRVGIVASTTGVFGEMLVGPDVVLPSALLPGLPLPGAALQTTSLVGYTRVGLVHSAGVNLPAVADMSGDVGVCVGYPGSQSLYMRTSGTSVIYLGGDFLLRGGDQ